MDDLIAFVRARLAEDAQAALDWQRHKEALTEQFMNDPRRKHVRFRREPVTDARLSEYAYKDRFDPARVLRDVEADRRTLVRCQEEMLSGIPRVVWFAKMTAWEMAQRWSDHDDFKKSWKP